MWFFTFLIYCMLSRSVTVGRKHKNFICSFCCIRLYIYTKRKLKLVLFFYAFLGGNKLQSTGNKAEDLKGTECVKSTPVTSVQIPEVKSDTVSEPVTPASLAALQSDVQPVGHDYVEEVLIS